MIKGRLQRFFFTVMLMGMSSFGYAETCPDPQDVRGGDLPANWAEVNREMTDATWFGAVGSTLSFVTGFSKVELTPDSAMCHYQPNVTLQNFSSFEPTNSDDWQKDGFKWTCRKSYDTCTFQ